MVSAYGFAQLLFRLPLGLYSDRIGRRKPFITLGLLSAGVAGMVLALSPSPEWMIVARFVSGISACSWVAFTVLYSGYYPPGQTTRAMGHISFVNGLSIMSSTYLGGWLADHYGWLAPFWASAGFGVLGTFVSLGTSESRVPAHGTLSLNASREILRHPTLIWSSIAASLGMYTVFTSSFGFLPNFALTLGATKTDLGMLSALTLLCGSVAGLSASRLALPLLGPRYAIVVAYGVVTLVTATIPHATEVWQLFVLQALSGLCRGTAYPIMMSLAIHGISERDKATAMGFFQAVYSAGMFLGPLVAGQIGGWMGDTMLFSSSALVAAVSVLASLKLPRRLDG